jgi:phage terminase small subunit
MAKAAPAPKPAPAARPAAPANLSPAMARWWDEMVKEHELEPHRLHLLELACRAKDRCEEARAAIAQHGATYLDRFNAPRTRPEVAIERDSRQAFARLLRDLDLRAPSPCVHLNLPSHFLHS